MTVPKSIDSLLKVGLVLVAAAVVGYEVFVGYQLWLVRTSFLLIGLVGLVAAVVLWILPRFRPSLVPAVPGSDRNAKVWVSVLAAVGVIGGCILFIPERLASSRLAGAIDAYFTADELKTTDESAWPEAIPVKVGAKTYYGDYNQAFTGDARVNLCFLVGPAGTGKSSLARRCAGELKKAGKTPVFLQLTKLPHTKAAENRQGGTLEGLCEVPIIVGCDKSARLRDIAAAIAAENIHSQHHELDKEAVKRATGEWMERQAQGESGLQIILDDLDEVGPRTFHELLSAAVQEVKSVKEAKAQKVTVILTGRTEMLYFGKDEVQLLNAQREAGMTDVRVADIEPIAKDDPKFELYLDSCFRHRDLGRQSADAKKKAKTELLHDLRGSPLPSLVEAVAYYDSAIFVANYYADRAEAGNVPGASGSFDRQAFEKKLYEHWWKRSISTHQIPALDNAGDFKKTLVRCVGTLPESDKDSNFDPAAQGPLLVTGFAVLVPEESAGSAFRIRLQFPFMRRWLIQ